MSGDSYRIYALERGKPVNPYDSSAGTVRSITKGTFGNINVTIEVPSLPAYNTVVGRALEPGNVRSPIVTKVINEKEVRVAPSEYRHVGGTGFQDSIELGMNFSSILHDTFLMMEQSLTGSVKFENEEGLIGRFVEYFAKKFVDALVDKEAAYTAALPEAKKESNAEHSSSESIIEEEKKEEAEEVAEKQEAAEKKANLFAAVKQYMTELLSASVDVACSTLAAQLMVPSLKSKSTSESKPGESETKIVDLKDLPNDSLAQITNLENGENGSYETDNQSFKSLIDAPQIEPLPEGNEGLTEKKEAEPQGKVVADLKYKLGQVLMQYLTGRDEHREGLIGAMIEMLEPALKPFQEFVAKDSDLSRFMSTATETLAIVNNVSKRFLGPSIGEEQPRVPEAGGNPPRWVENAPVPPPAGQVVEGEGQFTSWVAIQCKALFEAISSGAVAYLPKIVPYVAAYTLKTVVVQLTDRIEKKEDREAFNTLTDLLDEVMGAEPKPSQSNILNNDNSNNEIMDDVPLNGEEAEASQKASQEASKRCESIGVAIDKFLKKIREKNIDITLNGFTLPLPNPDASSEAQYPCMVATKIARNAEEQLAELEELGPSKVDNKEFSSNLSHYISARFIYELVAGLDAQKVEGRYGLYKDLFNKAWDRKNNQLDEAKFQELFFAALDAAQARGEISSARVWIAQTVYSFVESFFALTLRPFGNHFKEILEHLMENRSLIEAVANLILANLTRYLGNLIEAQRSVGSDRVGREPGYVPGGSLEEAMKQELSRITNEKMDERERYRQAIENAVEQFGPNITWVNDLSAWLNGLRFEEESSLSCLNPLISLVMSVVSSLAFILYLPQVMLNWGMRWTMKQVLIHTNILSGVIEKMASTVDGDIHTQIAIQKMLQAFAHKVHDSMLKQQAELEASKKNPSIPNEMAGSLEQHSDLRPEGLALDPTQEKLFTHLVVNLFDAMNYGNVDSREELRVVIREKKQGHSGDDSSFLVKIISGIVGIDFANMQKVIDKETHKKMVQILMRSYRQALDGDLIQQQIEEIMVMMNSMFRGEEMKSEEALRYELYNLKSSNSLLFSELIGFAIHNAIKDQFDSSGEVQRLAFGKTLDFIKEKAKEYVSSQGKYINSFLDENQEEGKKEFKKVLLHKKMIFNNWIASFHAQQSSNEKLQLLMTELTRLSQEYSNTLNDFLKNPIEVKAQQAQNVLDKISKWLQGIQSPTNVNIRIQAEFMDFLLGLMKNMATRHAKDHVDKMLKLLTEPYNVAGILNNVFLIPFAKKEFPFQQKVTSSTPIKV